MHVILVSLLGILIGTLTGLTPGIHVNTAVALIVSGRRLDRDLVILAISASIAHTFLDAVPSTFLGIPDESQSVSVYPAHLLAVEGRGVEAVAISALSGVIAAFATLPFFFLLPLIKPDTSRYTLAVLVFTVLFLISLEKGDMLAGRYSFVLNRLKASLVLLVSGILGFFAFRFNPPLFAPLFSGLFAFPVLYSGFRGVESLPQSKRGLNFRPLASLSGAAFGMTASLFPGISSGVASAMAVSPFSEQDEESYVAATGATNTANAILCLSVLIATGKARSGVAAVIRDFPLSLPDVASICVFSALASAIIAVVVAFAVDRVLQSLNVRAVCMASLSLLVVAVFLLTGFVGLILFALSSLAGLLPEKLKVRRIHCMGCLILPLIAFRLFNS